ncbi:hypothetical protein VAEU17_3180006 [Vibrio aestuarianus]|nr:hypothetical protein [Vibrio aestuarianus]CAH8206812.1 hypothetical protein VAEU17_3180006 [Vibrio aestuarianus]
MTQLIEINHRLTLTPGKKVVLWSNDGLKHSERQYFSILFNASNFASEYSAVHNFIQERKP